MSGIDFTNIENLTAQISALQSQQNSSTASTSGTASADAFILQTQQNFNSMLNNLMGSTGSDDQDNSSSSDPFASLTNDQTLQAQIQKLSNTSSNTGTQNLTTLDQNSQLLGKQAIYQDETGAQVTGVIAKILLDSQGNAIVEMTDGLQIPAASIIGLKQ
jgi:hypothetical protein